MIFMQMRSCGCPEHLVHLQGQCLPCHVFHLDCRFPGSHALSAKPLPGYTRVENEVAAFKCPEPASRCDAEFRMLGHVFPPTARSAKAQDSCSKGYRGPMCMDCAPNYFATGKRCEQCHDTAMFSTACIVAGILVVLAAVGVGTWLWMRRSTQAEVQNGPSPFSAFSALKEQLKAQVPILLQLCDLV